VGPGDTVGAPVGAGVGDAVGAAVGAAVGQASHDRAHSIATSPVHHVAILVAELLVVNQAQSLTVVPPL